MVGLLRKLCGNSANQSCSNSNKKLKTCGLKFNMKYIADCPSNVRNEIQKTDNVNNWMHNEDNIIVAKANY